MFDQEPSQKTDKGLADNWLKARRERALRLLATREHSQAEMHTKLARLTKKEQEQPKLLPAEAIRQSLIASLIEELIEQDFLSNERFIEGLRNKILRQGKGPNAFKQACQEHQLEKHLIAIELEKLEPLWQEQIQRVYLKKFGEEPLTSQKEKAKAARFLTSRGFAPSQIQEVLY